jgi:hypothetical protein
VHRDSYAGGSCHDIGAERRIAAEKGNTKIAVEIKVFAGPSAVHELEVAVG